MFMTVLAGFMVLLGRYTGLDDVVVGTPVANRDRAETEGLIGFFLNTLVMRADLSGDPSFAGLLGRVRAMALGAYAHQDLPFEQLVDELVTDRDRSRTPLFQALLNYITAAAGPGGGEGDSRDGRDGEGRPGAGVIAKFDLRLIVAEDGGGLAGAVEYSTALFEAATIGRLAGHLGVLLAGIAADADAPLSGLAVLTAGEREQLLAGWNQTAAAVPAAGGVHELVAGRAVACPDAVAVACGDGWLTYGGLAGRAGRLAGFLREQGVGAESVVGVCLEPGLELVTVLLAVWLAGGAYLPLDPSWPAARLGFMLADSRASVVVGTVASAGDLPAGRVRVIAVDDPVVRARVAAAVPPAGVRVAAGQVAYVMYTSGSTGAPKGVQVTHGGLVNYVAWVPDRTGFGERGARYGLVQPTGTDFGNTVLFTALATGGLLQVLGAGGAADPGVVARWLAGRGVDYLKVVPSHLAALAGPGGVGAVLPGRVLVLGGEATPGALAEGVLAAAGGRAVVNHYGPTETTIGVLTARLDGGGLDGGRVLIGSPAANTRVFVLDRCLEPVPAGVAGELFIGGAQLARGYGYRPALTAERFIADRFGGGGGRLYRTGDLARWRPGGQIEYLGRVDQQVKVRGFRVEPGEVEAVLAAHPAVAAVAVAVAGEQGQARLAAWLVPADPAAGIPPAGELREFVAGRLPEFMIPAVFTELAVLPLTPNGKLDRAALPVPGTGRPETGGTYVAPRGETEELLAGIWAQVLGLDRVGAQDNFFELGGHSLLATRVISRVREVFGTEVPVAALFDHPTVAGLAAVIAGTDAGPAAPPVLPVPRDQPLPLSFAQQRLWFLAQLEPGSTEYNVPLPLRLPGPVNVAALGAALTAITARHEVLRTRLVAGADGVPYQVIDPPVPFWLPVADVSGAADPPGRRGRWWRPMRRRRLTWRPGRWSGRAWSGWPPVSTCWCCRCTTWSVMSGPGRSCAGNWRRCTRPPRPGTRTRCRRCRCSTPISPSGSGRG